MNTEKRTSIRQWSEDDRPREKMLKNGVRSLSNAELIAILLSSGNRRESALDLAKRILSDYTNNLNELGRTAINDLMRYQGVGQAKAVTIAAALELGKRRQSEEALQQTTLNSSKAAYTLMYPLIGDLQHEEFWVILLNRSNSVIEKFPVSQGGITGTVVDIRMIMKQAIMKYATGIILCHNHPSGNFYPSDQDISLTNKIKEASGLFDINVMDHLIVAGQRYYSFADEGKL